MQIAKTIWNNLPVLCAGILLVAFYLAGWHLLTQAPAERRQVTEVRVTLTGEGKEPPVILGYQELGQNPGSGRSAEKDHLRLRRDASGGWWASNVADHRKVDAPTAQHDPHYLKRWRLATGDRIHVKTTELDVIEAQGEKLVLRESGREARWENGQLFTAETTSPACPDEATSIWRRWLMRPNQELFLFSLGGEAPCPQRWRLPGVPVHGIQVLSRDGRFWLAPGTTEARMTRAGESTHQGKSFKNIELRLDDPAEPVKSLILGRTRYRPQWQENVLSLIPDQKADLWRETDWKEFQSRPRDPRVEIKTALAPIPSKLDGLGTWLNAHRIGSLVALGLALAAAAATFWPESRSRNPLRGWQTATLALALAMGTLTLLTWRPPDAQPAWLLLSSGLAWITASGLLLINGRLQGPVGWLWVATIGLVGCGSLVQGQLGLGGDNSRWLDISMKHWLILAVIGWILALLALVDTTTWRRLAVSALDPWTHDRRWLHIGVIVAAGSVLAAQFAFGGEEGIWGIQPVEGIKVVLALMLAHAGARLWRWRYGYSEQHRSNPVRTGLPILGFVLIFLFLISGVLLAVRDLSPSLLMIT